MRSRSGVLLVGMLLVALLAGCSSGNRPGTGQGSGPGTGSGAAAAGSYAVTVQRGTTVLASLAPERLGALPQREVATPASAGDTTQRGPALADVLTVAGQGAGYTSIRVLGPSESVTLSAAEVTPDLLLATTRRGTYKLAGTALDPARWVRDVTRVEVTP
ncbi:hypothetical protein [Actinomycetospora chiangmaiensis]|uniref:hypothetical protein n=1 Tax=Actinomycetospora chiangmaiensis TaxID=402650 RepID=UPI000371074C|nr:hypothetical protein [Actinomycetospora chiangmaiensis]